MKLGQRVSAGGVSHHGVFGHCASAGAGSEEDARAQACHAVPAKPLAGYPTPGRALPSSCSQASVKQIRLTAKSLTPAFVGAEHQQQATARPAPAEQQPLKSEVSTGLDDDGQAGLISHPINCPMRISADDAPLTPGQNQQAVPMPGTPQTPKDVRGKISKWEKLGGSPMKGAKPL